MLKRILAGYAAFIGALGKTLLLAGICLGSALLIVWPLWKLASTNPSIYTVVFATFFGALVSWMLFDRLKPVFKRNPGAFARTLVRIAILAFGAAAIVILVLSWRRTAALAVFLLTIIGYGIAAFGFPPDSRK